MSESSKKFQLSTYLLLSFIILLSITVTVYIRLSSWTPQSIISYDVVGNLIQSRHFIELNKVSQVNLNNWRLQWVYNSKPLGFPILSAEFSILGNTELYYVGYFSVLFYIMEILLTFLLSEKLFRNRKISSFAAFLMATYLTGSANQGPLYAHYANLDLIFFLLILISFIGVKTQWKKMLLASLFFSGIMITHRPGLVFLFIFGAFLIFYSIADLIIRRNFKIWKKITIPYLAGFIFGWDISLVYWSHIKLENILLFGYTPFAVKLGGLPKFFLNLIEIITYPYYVTILISMNIFMVVLLLWIRYTNKKDISALNGFSSNSLKFSTFTILSLILPIIFIFSIVYVGNKIGIKYEGNIFSYLLNLWAAFSREAYFSKSVRILKQIFYLWHWNLFALLFLLPAIYVIYKNFRTNIYTTMLISALIFTLPLISFSQIYGQYTTVIERLYLYLAPLAYICISYSIILFIKHQRRSLRIKKVVLTVFVLIIITTSIVFITYSASFREPVYSDKQVEAFTYAKSKIPPSSVFTSGGGAIAEGNFYDHIRYKTIYPWWGQLEPYEFFSRAHKRGVDYIYSNTDPKEIPLDANPHYLDFSNYAWKVYATNYRTIYYVW